MKSCVVLPRALKFASVAVTVMTLGFYAVKAEALLSDDNSLIEGAKLCTRYLPRHEREYGIPVHLLAAIASTESGRFHKALGLNLPWPWTINVEGKGFFFDTKEEAIAAVRNFQAHGYQSIDVGCMQVNLHHHPYAFANLEQAFDPAYNVAYAAQFLKQNFQEEGSWRKATADYHSHTPIYGEQYANLVYNSWSRIINKVADARAGRPVLNATASREPSVHYHNHAAEVAANEVIRKARNYHAPHLNSISVSSGTTRENGVIVVRPDRAAPQEQASLDDKFVTRKNEPATAQSADTATPADSTDKGAKIVKVQDGRVVSAKGQFTPDTSHVIRVSDSSVATSDNTSSGKGMFVFDN